MELLQSLDSLRDDHLEAILELIDEVTEQDCPSGSSIVEMNHYQLQTGGKRLRALLPLAVAEAFGADPHQLRPFGAACELLHNATLVHDDLQDGDRLRRGHPAVWVKYGEARAINLGDAMLYLSLRLLERLEHPLAQRHAITHRLIKETLRVIDGQEREFLLKKHPKPGFEDYRRMVEGKTSGLFALPIAGAASLCGADEELSQALAEAASQLGVIFQIQDDILDLYGDKGRDQRGTDLGEGKISSLVALALERLPAEDGRWLMELLAADRESLQQEQVERACGLFESCGALSAAFDEIERRRQAALQIPALQEQEALRELLRQIAQVFLEPIAPLYEDYQARDGE